MRILLLAASLLLLPTWASAAFIVTAEEIGGDVVFSGSGSVNVAALTFSSVSDCGSGINPSRGSMFLGEVGQCTFFNGVQGATNFGSGIVVAADLATGGTIQIFGSAGKLAVDGTLFLGSTVTPTSSTTFSGATFASLGMVESGVFEWFWGVGTPDSDFVRLEIGSRAVVPEPATAWLIIAAIAGLFGTKLWKSPTDDFEPMRTFGTA